MFFRYLTLFLFISLLPAAVYAEGLQGCEDHVKYGAPSNDPVLICRMGFVLSHDTEFSIGGLE